MSLAITTTFLLSFVLLFVFRKVAKKINLVDKPNERKHHKGAIPLVGGVSIYCSILLSSLLYIDMAQSDWLYLACGAVLIGIGVLDDKFDISFKVRLFVQGAISLSMIMLANLSLESLGNIAGNVPVYLPDWVSYAVTIVAVIGAINAFNMVDGIDGLLGGLASVSFGALGIMFWLQGDVALALNCAMLIAAIIPYVLLNLGIPLGPRFKVFMGDAGSMLIGFTVVWFLIRGSQPDHSTSINPVTALWFIALPLMDMATIMVRRVRKGHSPFRPDREHLHHICQRIGLSSRMTLVAICLLAASFAGIGIWGELYQVNETAMFITFMALFAVYFATISHIFRITSKIRQWMGKAPLVEMA
ncbi:undecaprenyl-phosphate alpha-N-acetylglucosaminyl 1-phosphate transferase [Enterovibrio norvegicus FF-33]|uniref:UDP-N-acetylglucosamine--undecaprenyl-phosphate N-acetylglucosaminephosphotransferase n=1 Tax=Enterovibrio norvegicus TaxID=188144 RepID=UPI0003073C3F|nr:UDP-N-acetylglucosamine--undecaprenyl-phosphate N-acetylglucosaminephosphotransferase [Enterovibrio norvegicus]OEE68074.1 undecaprenyl-phosphate alpha-N-acetylglucosaminyl 1-phosphate transferase [Enterovibrio norvegicus FF-33]OEE86159.1 undecaprenyl-phosphate alpha-N-acetylglucosaminyl 1-phosphate transferase [Enterovibrio norvegicus FF-162]